MILSNIVGLVIVCIMSWVMITIMNKHMVTIFDHVCSLIFIVIIILSFFYHLIFHPIKTYTELKGCLTDWLKHRKEYQA